jgi:hypothetical protein
MLIDWETSYVYIYFQNKYVFNIFCALWIFQFIFNLNFDRNDKPCRNYLQSSTVDLLTVIKLVSTISARKFISFKTWKNLHLFTVHNLQISLWIWKTSRNFHIFIACNLQSPFLLLRKYIFDSQIYLFVLYHATD